MIHFFKNFKILKFILKFFTIINKIFYNFYYFKRWIKDNLQLLDILDSNLRFIQRIYMEKPSMIYQEKL
jgi:hypothetical protein